MLKDKLINLENPVQCDILIIGGDGLIGRALMERFKAMGKSVRYTTRNKNTITDCQIYLDMCESLEIDLVPSIVYFCAGITELSLCESTTLDSHKINVEATLNLAYKFATSGARVVYLSSHAVFDGSFPYVPINCPVCPTTQYGVQKAKAEQGILALGERSTVVRLPKVVSCKSPLFAKWIACLKLSQQIKPFSDLYLSPISLSYLTNILATKSLYGMVHLSGDLQLTYKEFALILAEKMDVSTDLVDATLTLEMGASILFKPLYTTLDMSDTASRFDIEPQTIYGVIEDLLNEFYLL